MARRKQTALNSTRRQPSRKQLLSKTSGETVLDVLTPVYAIESTSGVPAGQDVTMYDSSCEEYAGDEGGKPNNGFHEDLKDPGNNEDDEYVPGSREGAATSESEASALSDDTHADSSCAEYAGDEGGIPNNRFLEDLKDTGNNENDEYVPGSHEGAAASESEASALSDDNHASAKRPKGPVRESVLPRYNIRSRPSRVSKAIEHTDWNITGDWVISCNKLSDGRAIGQDTGLSMTILHDKCRPGAYMATFRFNVVKGIMRIVCVSPRNFDREIRGSYIYRGQGRSDNGLQLGSDQVIYDLSFGEKGSTLRGTFGGKFLGRVPFTGVKVGKGTRQKASSEAKWRALSEQHESVQPGRWKHTC